MAYGLKNNPVEIEQFIIQIIITNNPVKIIIRKKNLTECE
jgi:hypothetical protein